MSNCSTKNILYFLWVLLSFFIVNQIKAVSFVNGTQLFDPYIVHTIYINSNDTSLFHNLKNNPRTYYKVRAVIDGTTIDSVGIESKGNSSFGASLDKIPLRIDINKFNSAFEYDGLIKFDLLNQATNPSHLNDYLCSWMYLQSGIMAPRASFAKVYLNNVYWGLYTIIENVDKRFLKNYFPSANGNLYRFFGGIENNSSNKMDFPYIHQKLKNAGDTSWADVMFLSNQFYAADSINVLDSLTVDFSFDNLLKSCAVNWLTQNWDCSVMNNYFLYHNTADDKFYYIPWDNNITFSYSTYGTYNVFFQTGTNSVLDKVLKNPMLQAQYFQYLCEINNQAFDTTRLFAHIDTIFNLIKNDLFAEDSSRRVYSDADIIAGVNYGNANVNEGLKSFVPFIKLQLDSTFQALGVQCVPTSLTESPFLQLHVPIIYPNPAQKEMHINAEWIQPNDEVFIFNMYGCLLLNERVGQQKKIDLTSIAPGCYWVVVNNKIRPLSEKLIIHF